MRTYPGQQAIQIWLLGAAVLLGLVWWSTTWIAPFLIGSAALLAALEMTSTLYPQQSRSWHWALIGGCGLFAAGLGAVWLLLPALAVTTLVLLVLAVILIRQRRPKETDRLTGLLPPAIFTARAGDELSRGLRFGRPAALAVIVFDQAVAIRQDHGRQTARVALQRIAEGIASQSRTYDLLTRLDNTRFAILLPETSYDEALSAAERIRATIAALPFVPANTETALPLSVNVGIAHHPQEGDAIQVLLDKASQRSTVTSTARHEPMTAPKVVTTTSAAVPPKPLVQTRPQWYQFAYITAVWFLGLLVFALTFQPIEPQHWLFFLTLAVIAVASRQMRIELYGRGSVANHFVALLAGGIFISPTAAMLLGIASGWILLPTKMKPRAFVFDAASFALSAGGATLFARAIAPYLPTTGLFHWPLIVHGLILGGACYLINLLLLVGVVSCAEGGNSLAIWRERYSWFLPYTLIFGVLAVFMVEAGKALGPLGMIVFAVPTFMMRLVTKQYVDRTKDHVLALREAHNHLAKANEELRETVDALERSYSATLSAFSGMLDARDSETEGHSQRVVTYAIAIGRAMQLDAQELTALEVGALLHDIGKVGVSDAILRKNGPLNDAEWMEMRRHPEIGHQLTSGIPFLHTASPVVRHHHERWDGKGYPDRLRGEDIPLVARIFAVADSFDAMISDRPYRRGLSYEQAIEELQRVAGVQFDPQVIETFLQLITTPGWIETVKQTAQTVQLPAQQQQTLVTTPQR